MTPEESEDRLLRTMKELNDQKYALDLASIVAITDASGVITYVNDKFVEISKYSREELIGRDHRLVSSGYHSKEFFKDLWGTISRGGVWNGEIKNRTKDGDFYWVHTTIIPFVDHQSRPYQYMAIRTDITEKKAALEQLETERARSIHSEKMAGLGQIAAGIAHELGNPIASITAWLSVLSSAMEAGNLESMDLRATLPAINQRAKQMQSIISGMLTYARDGSKDEAEGVNLRKAVQSVLDYSSYQIKKSGVRVSVEEDDKTVFCRVRQTQLAQVIVNLLTNACDAAQESEEKWVKISVYEQDSLGVISVVNSGPRIPDHVREKMFEPFFTTKGLGKGTGLGLSISKQMVEEDGGQLVCDSEGSYTIFRIMFPLMGY